MIFLIGKRHSGRDDYTVARVYADGIEIFHRTDGDDIAYSVSHDLELYFLPAVNALFDKHLRNRRKRKSARCDFPKLRFVCGYAAACTAERECGAHYYGIAYLFGEFHSRGNVVHDRRGYARLIYGLHCLLKQLSVLRLFYRLYLHAEKLHAALGKEAAARKLHGKRKSRLTAERRKYAVGLFEVDYSLECGKRERLDIYRVRHCPVRHYGRGIGVYQHDFDLFGLKRSASLRPRIVELRRLTDGNGTRTYYKHFFDFFILRHSFFLRQGS